MTAETFEQVLTAAQAEGSFNPAWKKFVNTKFFVAVVHGADQDPRNFTLHTAPHPTLGTPAVQIAEVRDWVPQHGTAIASLSGAEIVRLLQAEASILVALSDRAFSIARDRVDWLKQGIEAAQARAAARAREAAAAAQPFPTLTPPPAPPPAPAPAPAPAASPAPASGAAAVPAASVAGAPAATSPSLEKAPAAPVRRAQGGVLDVAALKPRSVAMPEFGLNFFVPGDWRESRSAKALRFADEVNGTRVEVSGLNRENVSLQQWLSLRQNLVQHEMRYLTQHGEAVALDGDDWRDRVKGIAVEYRGTVPGETAESCYLLACVRVEGTMVAIGIRAPAEVFEQQRSLYKWLLSRIELVATPPVNVYQAGAAGQGAQHGYTDGGQEAGMFGMSMEGRIGRLRALAYSIPTFVPFFLLTILGGLLMLKSPGLGIVVVITGSILLMWFTLRLMVLRLHDLNRSGKWVLGLIVVIVLAALTRKPILFMLASLVFWLGSLLIYYILPGNDGDNDYGPPPAENTTLIKVGAAIFCALQLLMIAGQIKMALSPQSMQGMSFGGSGVPSPDQAGVPFSPPDNSFVVELPDEPEEVPSAGLPANSPVRIEQYQLSSGDIEYMIQAIDYGAAPDDRFAAMNNLERAVAQDGTLVEAKPFMFNNGVIGREVRVNLRGNMVRVARFALVGSKLCVVMVAAQRGAAADAHIAAVFKTFQLR